MPELRVAVVYDCFFPLNSGGGERVYRRLSEVLALRGFRVDYLTRRQWAEGEQPDPGFTIVPVWRGEIYRDDGTRTSAGALRFALAVFRRLRRSRGQYDIVIASALPVLTLLAARAALLGTRSYLVGDWLEIWTWSKWRAYAGLVSGTLAFVLQRLGVRAGDLATVNSSFTASRFRGLRGTGDPVVLGLVDLVESVPERRPADDPPFLLAVGRLIADKRVADLPAALAVARRSHPDLTARIVGTGPEHDRIVAEIRRAGLERECLMLGHVDDEALATLFAGAVALANLSRREGFGLVVAEAASFGVPSLVVAGADNAAVDLIDDGVNGTIALDSTPEEIAAALVRLVDAGQRLRQSSADWFERERGSAGLSASVDAIVERYRASAKAR